MANDFYNHDDGYPAFNAQGASAAMRLEFDKIAAGFEKFPVMAGNGGKILAINVSATGLEYIATTGTGSIVRATDPTFVLTDTTTNDASTLQHGWMKKLSGSGTQFFSGLGTWVSIAGNSLQRSPRTANTIIAGGDNATFIDVTSGTFTQTFTAAATLGSNWYCYYRNSGTGDITLDPNSTELIDGLTSYIVYPGEVRLIGCDGTSFYSTVLRPFSKVYTANGTFVSPPGYQYYGGLAWGGGGSGARSGGADGAGGGGGGNCLPFTIPVALFGVSQAIVVGSGGAAISGASVGSVGNISSIGTFIYSYGGGGGGYSATNSAGGGGGGGSLGAGTTGSTGSGNGGIPRSIAANLSSFDDSGFGGANGAQPNNQNGGNSAYGGAGGASSAVSIAGNSVYGGAGGGGVNSNAAGGTLVSAGTSLYGGNGGAAGNATSGVAGSAPGGGGGATRTGATSGAGGRGEIRIWGVV